MELKNNTNLEIILFNVGRGLSLLIKTPHNHVVLYDMGSSEDLSPVTDIYRSEDFFSKTNCLDGKIIAQCIISHPHLDHISDLTDENASFINENSAYITCQNDKNENDSGHKIDFSRVNNPKSDSQITNYKALYRNRCLPLRTINPNKDGVDFQMGYYYLTHAQVAELFPKDDQKYSNSLSIVLYLSYKGLSILIPGDITPEAFEVILNGKCEKRFTDYSRTLSDGERNLWASSTSDQPNLGNLLSKKGLTVLVAPHHGLESGYPKSLFDLLGSSKPEIILISEKSQTENSGKVDQRYQNGTCSTGLMFGSVKRFSLTTRNDGHIKICFKNDGKGGVNHFSKIEDLFGVN